jgi:hypothetical protein
MCSKWEDNIKMNAGAVLVLEMPLLLGEGPTGQACECTHMTWPVGFFAI